MTTALNTVIGQSAVMGTAMVQKGFSSVELVCSSFLLAACPNESNDEDEKEVTAMAISLLTATEIMSRRTKACLSYII